MKFYKLTEHVRKVWSPFQIVTSKEGIKASLKKVVEDQRAREGIYGELYIVETDRLKITNFSFAYEMSQK